MWHYRLFSFRISNMNKNSTYDIYLKSGCQYDEVILSDALGIILRNMTRGRNFRSSVVLLKPNLISSVGSSHGCTDGRFIAGVARWFVEHGAVVKIGDSPAYGTTRSVFEKQGLLKCIKGIPVDLVNFKTPLKKELGNGLTIGIAAEACDCDCLVNLPRLKAHNQMYMTGAVKNFFGTVVGLRKGMLHMKNGGTHQEFADILLRIPSILPPNISLIDCIEVMNRTGPLEGEILNMGFIGGSKSSVALDSAICSLPGMQKDKIPLYRQAVEIAHPAAMRENHHYPIELPETVTDKVFNGPDTLNPVRFNPFRFLGSISKRLKLAIPD